jgi:hypothetical protein
MQSKKINELATNLVPAISDLVTIGNPSTGELKKITLNQIASLFGSVGGVSSVGMTVPTGLTVTGSPITTSGTLAVSLTSGYSIPTTAKQTEWDAGYSERLKWDGGSSGLNASTARSSLGLVIGTDVLAYRTFGSAANNNTGDFATASQGSNADTAYSLRLTGASLPLSISGNIISIAQSSSTINGFLSSTDFNTFNAKQQALNGTGFVKASGTSITYDNSTYLTTSAAASTYLTISNASSTYLPLSGGTLTGSLNGTSATFTSGTTGPSTGITSIGDITTARTSTTGAIFLGTSGSKYLYYDGTKYLLNASPLEVGGSVTATQGNFFQTASSGFAINLRNRNSNQQWGFVVDVNTVDDKYFGLYDVTNSAHRFVVSNGGNVGIGTTSPAYLLDVRGSGMFNGDLKLDNNELNTPKTLFFSANSTTGGSYGNIKWYNVQWDGYTRGEIVVEGDGALSNGRMVFKTGSTNSNATEKMRITSGGNVLIGTADLGYKLSVNGDVLATAFYESSDIRFKNVLETNPIIDIDGIEVIKFNRKDNASIRYGYSAQQVQEFVPDAVSGENELVVNYSDVHTLKIAALERRILELENKLK